MGSHLPSLLVRRLLSLSAIVAIGLTVFGLLGRWSIVADGVDQLASLWIAAGFVSLLLLALLAGPGRAGPGRWSAVGLGVLVAASAATLYASYRAQPIAAPGAIRLRIVSMNVWKQNRTPVVTARWILGQTPDVIILLEAGGRGARVAQLLAARYPYRTSCRLDLPCSTLILSKIAPLQRFGLAHGDAENQRALSAALVRFGAPYPPFSVIAVHLSHAWPFGPQALHVARLVSTDTPRDRLIVAGDFNATPWTQAPRRIEAGLDVRRITGGFATWPTPDAGLHVPPLFAIDHIFIGRGWSVERLQRGPAIGSDHYPLSASLMLSDGG